MSNVGYATLQVIPSVRGISDELRRQLIGPAGDAGDAAGDAAGGGFRDAFTGVLGALGVAAIASKIGEQFTEAWNQALEQSSITGTLKGQLGATQKDAARYGKVAGQLFASGITDDLESAAESVRATLQGGLVPPDATKKQLREIATEMSDVATTFGSDMSLQSQAVAAQLKNGLAPNAKAALDVITVGFQKLGPNAEDLLETFQEYPVQLKKLGLDSKTALGLFSQGIQGGARDTDIIADSLKEFSIRSIDMSASSRAAYKSLGLDAQTMEQQIAKGGSSATAGLQTVLDKLRGIHDPVKREAAAVGLFGTQAEELGTSLFKLDPSKATSAMGDVGGAAAQLGKDLRSGPSYEIKVFTRGLQQAFVTVLGGQVLPVAARVGSVLNRTVLPPLVTIATVVGGAVIGALKALWTTGTEVVNWLQEMGTWLIPIGIAVAGFTAAILAQQIVVAATTLVFSIYRGAILAWTAVQRGATIAQLAFNAVMNANVIVLVITAIVALGAALVVAYQRSETFRAIVQGAWAGIQTAALFVWNQVLKPTFASLMTGLSAIGTAFSWLWSAVIQPVFGFISTAARIWLTIMTIVVFGPIYLAVKALGAIFSWLWTNAISPAIGWIVAGAKLLWSSVQAQFNLFMAGIRLLGSVGLWLWRNVFSPVVGWIVAGAKLLWSSVRAQFNLFMAGIRALGSVATWLYRNAIAPAFRGIATVAAWLYEKGIKPPIDQGRAAAAALGKAFTAAKDTIGEQFGKIANLAKKPIAFVINTVYNGGIVPVWNKVASAFGAPTLSKMPKFAVGGPVFGAGTETSDSVPAWLSRNEHVWTAREVRGAGGHGAVMALRKWAAAGGSDRAPGFASGGGLFGWVGKAASKGVDLAKEGVSWLKDGMKASALAGLNSIVKPLLNKISGSASLYRDMITGIPRKMLSAIIGFSGTADTKLEAAGIGGKGFAAGLAWARTQNGKSYQWGGNGNPSWDCLTLSSMITTPQGHTELRDLHPGMQVLAYQGGKLVASRVLAKWSTGEQELFKVRTRNRSLRATGGHRVLVAAPMKRPMADTDVRVSMARWGTEWKHVRDLTPSDYLVTYTGSPKEGGEEVPEDLAWLMGLWLADGSVHTSGGIRICVYNELADKAMAVLREHAPDRNVSHHPRHGVMVSDIQRARWMIRNGFTGKSHERTIPPVVMEWSEGAQTAFLKGYADGDGSYKNRGTFESAELIQYKATSRELIEGIREMHIRRGDRVSVTHTQARTKDVFIGGKKIKNARPIYSVDVAPGKGTTQTTGAGHRPGLLRLVQQLKTENMSVQKVLSVEPDGVEETWDIEVEDSHSFVSDGLISHNCSGLVSAIESVIRGQKPHRRWATGAFSGATAPPGWVLGAASPYKIGITNKGVGHTAGTINGVNVESRGGDGVVIGSGARGYRNSLFTHWYGFKGYAGGTRGAAPGWAWVGELGPELVNFGGGEQVLNHRDSLNVAGSMGAMPGYAKGTKGTAARKDLPGDLSSVSKALTASAADIKKAFDELTKDLRTAGGSAKRLTSSTTAASAKLQALAKRRDVVDARIAAAKETAADQKKTAADFLGLGNLAESTSVKQIIAGLQGRQKTVRTSESAIAGLSKRGLNQSLIGQLVALGPDSGLAGVVAKASKGQIAQLNQLAASGAKLSTSYGNTMADAMFDAGKNSARGFLTGLQSQQKELQAAMNKLGDGLVATIKRKLKIKSPSRVTTGVGEMAGAGVRVGLDNTTSAIAAAAARVADAAVPSARSVQPGLGTAVSGEQPIVVELHTRDEALADFVDVRVRQGNRVLTGVVSAGRR
ncbi:phage tail tape measure protein [Streptomyces canus]|uniref:phage tail tape measure protein n=1 Tax=Streptomyces canus TaxID=58343 RepID=UPI00386E608E|nr:replication protein [Streptomyces canus]